MLFLAATSSSAATQTGTPPEVVMVQKSALAFRYKPPSSQNPDSPRAKRPFELTLEYGPQRTGADMESEAIPFVEGGATEEEGKFVSWNNEGKIYYETSIEAVRWDSANFMAPITGAVLSKVLDHALDYTTQYPRYQPFEVYDVAQNVVVVHSSSSDDFVWGLFGRLASLNVNLRPLLLQPQRKMRLYVNTSLEEGMLNVSNSVDSEQPDVNGEGEGDETDFVPPPRNKVVQRIEAVYANKAAAAFFEELYRCGHALQTREFFQVEQSESLQNSTQDESLLVNETNANYDSAKENYETINSNSSYASTTTPTGEYKNDTGANDTYEDSVVHKGKQKKKKGNRTLSHLPMSSYSSALSLPPKDALLSGDGQQLMSTLSLCFTSPQYQINNVVYLYIDGVTYYKVNLSYPYWSTLNLIEPLPAPYLASQGRGDALDWSLALLILGGFVFGVYLILVQSGIVRTPTSVRRCLRSFFHSDHHTASTAGQYTTCRTQPDDLSVAGVSSFAEETTSTLPDGVHDLDSDSNFPSDIPNQANKRDYFLNDNHVKERDTQSKEIELNEFPNQRVFESDQSSSAFRLDDLLGGDLGRSMNPSGSASLDSGSFSCHSLGNLSLEEGSIQLCENWASTNDVVARADLKSSSKVAVPVSIASRVIIEKNEPSTPRRSNYSTSGLQIV